MTVDLLAVEAATRALLLAIGEDPDREGLQATPARVARAYREFIDYDPGTLSTAFSHGVVDQLVIVSGVRVASMCEHHLMLFTCEIAIGYLADGEVLGLSKLARLAHLHAHRLQLQERLVEGIADDLATLLTHQNVAVLARGEHTCMSMRGIRTPGIMTTSAMRGAFRDQASTREEFLRLALS